MNHRPKLKRTNKKRAKSERHTHTHTYKKVIIFGDDKFLCAIDGFMMETNYVIDSTDLWTTSFGWLWKSIAIDRLTQYIKSQTLLCCVCDDDDVEHRDHLHTHTHASWQNEESIDWLLPALFLQKFSDFANIFAISFEPFNIFVGMNCAHSTAKYNQRNFVIHFRIAVMFSVGQMPITFYCLTFAAFSHYLCSIEGSTVGAEWVQVLPLHWMSKC